jgi:beta-galactosidase
MRFKTDHLIYGGDYNPEQWEDREDILEEDIRLMKEAHINEVTLGVFSWAREEPTEGEYDLSWLRRRVDLLYENGIETILATPSGARPRWLAEKYPEVLRVDETRHRNLFGRRHNHCYTSPVYREKVWEIDHKLAEEFRHHPGIKAWHISNEFGGDCHCPLCQKDFRNYLWEKYDGDIDNLNHAWWNTFWSHTYDSFEQIESPSPRGENSVNALDLEWKRFVSHQTTDFMKHEIAALRDGGAMQPVTTNFMYDFDGLDYEELAKHLDVISWDSYPFWYGKEDIISASEHAFYHDVMRSLKKKPFLLMESSTTSTNWMPVSRLRRPGILENASLSAVAHGSDSVQYFQIRAGRGGEEKLHGAVISHYGGTDTRIFGETRRVGEILEGLSEVAGSLCDAKCAIIYDTQNRWALEDSYGPRNAGMGYHDLARKCYRGVKAAGLDTDIFSQDQDFSGYKLIIVPMLYMFIGDFEERV